MRREVEEQHSQRSEREERYLWRALAECDRRQAQEEKKKEQKRNKKIQQARVRMGAWKNQPRIMETLKEEAKGDVHTEEERRQDDGVQESGLYDVDGHEMILRDDVQAAEC